LAPGPHGEDSAAPKDDRPLPDEPESAMLVCPTCDEPFRPEFLRQCQRCGHEFPDGVEADPELPLREPLNLRVIGAMAALVVLGLLLAVFFSRLF
jgi:hypothetical protein